MPANLSFQMPNFVPNLDHRGNDDIFNDMERGEDVNDLSDNELSSHPIPSLDEISLSSRDSVPLIPDVELGSYAKLLSRMKMIGNKLMANKCFSVLFLILAIFCLIIFSVMIVFQNGDAEHQHFENSVFVSELKEVLKECFLILERKAMSRFVSNLPLAYQLVLREQISGHCPDLKPASLTFDMAEECLRRFE